MRTLCLIALIAPLAVSTTIPLMAQSEELSLREAAQIYSSQDSLIRHEAWKRLNPEDSKHMKLILNILAKKPWFDRSAAIEALAKAGSDNVLEEMMEQLEKSKSPFVRQGMAKAIALMNDPKSYSALYKALEDDSPAVRRVVVHALGLRNRRANVDALVELFQTEKDPVVRTFIEQALNSITHAYQGTSPLAWKVWWEQAKNDKDYKLGKTDEEAIKQAEKLGNKLRNRTTVLAGVRVSTASKGSGTGVPILIIPPYGYSKEIMLPFLSELERFHTLHYIDLPPIESFKDLKTAGKSTIPFYPIDKLVDAFEDLRKKTREEHFAIMSCGMNSWIAMRYAQRYPQSVAANIFVAPISSNKEYGDATKRFKSNKEKDLEAFYFGLTRTFNTQTGESSLDEYHREKEVEKPKGQRESIDRRSWGLFFKDEQDGLIELLYPKKNHRMGSVAIPKFSLFKEKPPARRIPTLVIVGAASLYTSVADCQQVGKYYKSPTLVFKNSSCMPFAEEGEKFNQVVAKFLKKYTRLRAPAKVKDSDDESAGEDEKKSRKKRTRKKDD